MKKKNRSPVKVGYRKWTGYLAAATASAVFVQNQAFADVHVDHYGVDLIDSVPDNGSEEQFDFLVGGLPSARVVFNHIAASSAGALWGLDPGPGGNRRFVSFAGFSSSYGGDIYNYLSNPVRGAPIQSLGFLSLNTSERVFMAWVDGFPQSQFVDRGGYFAFRFDVGMGTQYGWGELELIEGPPLNFLRLERIVWADAGETLKVGVVPEAGSLALLATGATGLLLWRRKRKS